MDVAERGHGIRVWFSMREPSESRPFLVMRCRAVSLGDTAFRDFFHHLFFLVATAKSCIKCTTDHTSGADGTFVASQ